MLPRRSFLEAEINGTDISEAISDQILSFTYTDRASGESDSIDLTVTDKEGKWVNEWYPKAKEKEAEPGGNSDYSQMAKALQEGISTANLQRLIDASDLTAEQGRELQRVTNSATWSDYVAQNPQYRGESGKKKLIEDIKAKFESPEIKAGDKTVLRVKLCAENWNNEEDYDELDCGAFEIDTVDSSGPPAKAAIKAVSIPVSSSLKCEEKTNTWEEATLQKIAQSIADKAGLELIYEVESDIKFDRVDQQQQTDMSFLMELCAKYGVALKATDGKIVLFEESVYEEKEPIDTFDIKSETGSRITGYSFSQDTNDTVSKVELYYKDPKSGTVAQGEFTPPNPPATGQKLVLNERPGDLRGDNFRNGTNNASGSAGGTFDTGMHPFSDITADFQRPRTDVTDNANRICRARCREKNKKEWTCTLTITGNVKMVGGVTINITNWGVFSGKYMVDTATHKRSGKYTTSINAHRVLGY